MCLVVSGSFFGVCADRLGIPVWLWFGAFKALVGVRSFRWHTQLRMFLVRLFLMFYNSNVLTPVWQLNISRLIFSIVTFDKVYVCETVNFWFLFILLVTYPLCFLVLQVSFARFEDLEVPFCISWPVTGEPLCSLPNLPSGPGGEVYKFANH